MLARYFGFEEDPFGATPDPRFLYSSRTHREALASLQYAFYSNRGFTALIAPPGMGKTTLLFEFLERNQSAARTVFLFNSQCEASDLLRQILHDIGLEPAPVLADMLQQLNAELTATARHGRHFVVVVDEAQNLSEEALEMLRLLTNFETARAKLMQIVLSGQPRLAETLLSPELVQLRQRISTFCRLEPFTPGEAADYIVHRLRRAGYKGAPLFTSEALTRIAEVSGGIPRNINTVCFNALSLCCGLRRRKVDLAMVNEAIHDLQIGAIDAKDEPRSTAAAPGPASPQAGASRRRRWIPALAGILVVGAAGAFGALYFHTIFPPGASLQTYSTTAQTRPQAAEQHPVLPAIPGENNAREQSIEVTVQPEETLSGISVRSVGAFDRTLLRQIQELNPNLANPDLILPGQKILLPEPASPPKAGSRPQ